jgi:hypothetical protein
MAAKVTKIETNVILDILDRFRQMLLDYLHRLPSSVFSVGGTVMSQVWCHPGRTGILRLLLCLYWHAKYSGTGPDWNANMKCIKQIYNAIIEHPDLFVNIVSLLWHGY